MSKQTDYQTGRLDGLAMALRIVKEDGVEMLEKECRVRGAWGDLNTPKIMKELDKASDPIKEITYQTILIAGLSVLHDKFGFGEKRCQRFVSGFDKLVAYLDHGWVYWYDVITDIRSRMNLEMHIDALTSENIGRTWAHPEPEDIYTEQDFVDPAFWQGMLNLNGFSEITRENGEHVVLDETGREWFSYDNLFDRISVYDAMQGVLWAKEHYGIGKKKEKIG